MRQDSIARFWSLVDRSGDCWLWTGYRTIYGYGRTYFARRYRPTHRISWELTHGPVPPGMYVLHRCDNRPCCNPGHLFLGTNTDNMADREAKGRGAKGEQCGRARLTATQVAEIREKVAAKAGSYSEIGALYGAGRDHVYLIAKRKIWKSVP